MRASIFSVFDFDWLKNGVAGPQKRWKSKCGVLSIPRIYSRIRDYSAVATKELQKGISLVCIAAILKGGDAK